MSAYRNLGSGVSFPRPHALLIATLLLFLCGPSVMAFEFEIFEVSGEPITGGRGLDDLDCQVGYYQTDAADFSTAHAIRRCSGIIESIDPPTSLADRRAFGINSSGVVVGSALRAEGSDGFEFDGATYTWVEFPGAAQTVLRDINDAGDVVGEYETAGGQRRGFARLGGVFVSIDFPLAVETRVRGINNKGEMVGFAENMAGIREGFIRTPDGIFTTLSFSGAVELLLGGINDTGEMVGTFIDAGGAQHGVFITAPLVEFLPFDVPGSVGTIATGINEAGEVTGEWVDALGVRRGFVGTEFLFADGFESGGFEGWSNAQP